MIRLTLKPIKNDEAQGTPLTTDSQSVPSTIMPKLRINLTNTGASNHTTSTTATTTGYTAPPPTLPHSGLEEQFILRLPPSLTSILNSELAENEYTSPGDLSLKFLSSRTAIVKHPRFIKEAYPAVLMDSPTIMETLKSSNLSIVGIGINGEGNEEEKDQDQTEAQEGADDSIQFKNHHETEINVGQYYKVADLNQILMVLDLDTTEGQRIFNKVPSILQEQLLKALQSGSTTSSFTIPAGLDDITASWAQWPDGLTLPMRSAKIKRFAQRPLHASTVGDLERIEKEVERLIRSDGQAIESKFTLIGADGQVLLGDSDVKLLPEDDRMDEDDEFIEEEEEEEEEEEFESSSASDIEDMNDFAAEIEDNLLEQPTERQPDTTVISDSAIPTAPVTTDIQPPQFESESDRLVKDLEAKLAEKLKQAESVSNPLIKARIEDVIKQMEDNLRNLKGGRE